MSKLRIGLVGGVSLFLFIIAMCYVLRSHESTEEFKKGIFVMNEVRYAQSLYKRI